MKYLLVTAVLFILTNTSSGQNFDLERYKTVEQALADVMELMDTTEIKSKLIQVEQDFKKDSTQLNQARLGIIYHEVALSLSFLSKTAYKGYAKKSFDHLTERYDSEATTAEFLPFVASYQASALSLMAAETKKLNLLDQSFDLFERAVSKYAEISPLPEFLRGSVAENLPWFFFKKHKFAKKDFEAIINKYEKNKAYGSWKIMSFTYWAWAKQHQKRKDREQALSHLEKAIQLDPNYKAGRKKAEELKAKLLNKYEK